MVVLDSSQQAAASSNHAVQLVLAGPGAGKTHTLVGRFKHLVAAGVDPRRILAVTFTKKAAEEMRIRIARTGDIAPDIDLRVFTFHALALRCLQRNPHLAGLQPGFDVWGQPQQRAVFFKRRMFWNEDQDILDIIGAAKEQLLDAKTFEAGRAPEDRIGRAAVPFFKAYEQALRQAGAIDFADMVPLLIKAIDDNPGYGQSIGRTVDHLLIDEYQDVNPAQERLIGHFRSCGVHLWAVGDDDQTLYTFRSADVRHILGFETRYPGALVHRLDRNYRSTPQIVAGARALISRNKRRFTKDFAPTQPEAGSIAIRGYSKPDIEVRQVTRTIAALLAEGMEPQQIAVLYRAGSTGLGFQIALGAEGIPFEVRGAGDLWQGATARLFLGSLFYLLDADDSRALEMMGTGKRGSATRERLDEVPATVCADFTATCRAVHDIVADALPAKASQADRREWSSVAEAIVMLATSCVSLSDFEDKIAAQSRRLRTPSQRAVVLSTVHSAKGLEWDAVFVVGLEEGLMPSIGADLEEERRIAYVAVTRARLKLGLTYARQRGGSSPRRSRFIEEFTRGRFAEPEGEAAAADECLVIAATARDETAPVRRAPSAHAAPAEVKRAPRPSAKKPRPWNASEDRKLRFSFASATSLDDICVSVERSADEVLSRLVVLRLVKSKAAGAALWD